MGKMILECPECGNEMIADEGLKDGYVMTCPACGAKSEYCASDQDDSPQSTYTTIPTHHLTQPPTPQRRPAYTYANLKAEMKAEMDRKATETATTRASRNRNVALFIALLLLTLGTGGYYYYRFIYAENIYHTGDIPSTQSESEVLNTRAKAPEIASEDELRRQKIKEEEERHKLERQQKQEQKEKERAEQRARLVAEKTKAKELEKAYRDAQSAFAGKPSYFAFSAPDGAALDPRQMKEAGKLWAIDKSFMGRGLIYEIKTGGQGVESVTVLSNRETPHEIGEKDFVELFNKGMWAVSNGECTWLWGTGNGSRQIPVPTDNMQLYPLKDELADIFEAINSMRIKLPDVKYRLTLKSKRGDTDYSLGIFSSSDKIASEKIQNPIREKLANARCTNKMSKIGKPKMKKFKPTVVLYEGTHIKKGLDGTTYIPRTFRYFGTNRHYDERAKRHWESLCAEARRQEQKAREVEEENRAAMREYERKMEEAQNIRISESEIDAELQKYDLLIERSKTKYP